MDSKLLDSEIFIISHPRSITIDGSTEVFDFTLPADIHMIKWNNGKGEVEYNDGRSHEGFKDFSIYEYLIDDMFTAKASREAGAVAEGEALLAQMTYADKRRMEYPDIYNQLEALYDARNGDTSKLDILDLEIQRIKQKYPK